MSTSPIHRLPDDILLQIFVYHTPQAPFHLPSLRLGPLLFYWICQRWRNLVHQTPHFWATVPLMVSPFHPKLTLEHVKEWVERAGECGLRLSLQEPWTTPYRLDEGKHMSRVTTEVAKWLGRWKDVVVELREPNCARLVRALDDDGGDLEMLKSLSMSIRKGSDKTSEATIAKASWKLDLSSAAQLVWLRIYGNIDVVLGHSSNSHRHLRTACFMDVHSHYPYLNFLVHLPSIETFEVVVENSLYQAVEETLGPLNRDSNVQITLPRLRTLRIIIAADPIEFLESLVLPELQHLELSTNYICRRLEGQSLREVCGRFIERGRTSGPISPESLMIFKRTWGGGYHVSFIRRDGSFLVEPTHGLPIQLDTDGQRFKFPTSTPNAED